MRLEKLILTVVASSKEEWHSINCWAQGSGPSYRSYYAPDHTSDGRLRSLDTVSHRTVAVFKPDVSITMAFGMPINLDLVQDWANIFPNPKASSHRVDLFYNNALVYRDLYASVDGGKGKLPFPKGRHLKVPKGYYYFIKVLDNISGYQSRFESYFSRSDLKLTEDPWPDI